MSISASVARRLAPCWSKQILYVDRGIVVLNKPSGLICQTEQNGGHSVQPVREHLRPFLSKTFSDTFAYDIVQ